MANETMHTPGPWSRNIPPASQYPVIFSGRNTHVAQVITRGCPVDQVEANANLIAAAPELLAMLELMNAEYDWPTASLVIAKARGVA